MDTINLETIYIYVYRVSSRKRRGAAKYFSMHGKEYHNSWFSNNNVCKEVKQGCGAY